MRLLRRLAWLLFFSPFVALAALAALGWRQREEARLLPGAAGDHVGVDGTPIRYVQKGTGPDVLLVHGSPGSVEDWEPILDALAQRYRVTAFDRPGHGFSGGHERPHTPHENGDVALGLIRALGLRDVVYVGHSYGGITGLDLAIRAPEEIRAFVLVGSRAYAPTRVDGLYRLLALPLIGRGVARVLAPLVGPGRIETGVRESFGPNLDLMPHDFVARRAALWMRPAVSAALSEERVTLQDALEGMAPRYPGIRKPLFLVCGEQDGRNVEDARRLAADVAGARLILLADTGHYVQFARPRELLAAIDEAAGVRDPAAQDEPQAETEPRAQPEPPRPVVGQFVSPTRVAGWAPSHYGAATVLRFH